MMILSLYVHNITLYSPIIIMNYINIQKHLTSYELRSKFKKQCLKAKNILF